MSKHLFLPSNDNVAKQASVRKKISDAKWRGNTFTCIDCGVTKRCSLYQVPTKKFCSRRCKGSYMSKRSGAETPNYKRGYIIDKSGYKQVLVKNHSRPHKLEHRLVVERAIGRELLPDEHIHHKDHDKLNNHIDNLVITNSSDHRRIHPIARNDKGQFTG